ncbi:MAG: RDD family protein [Acidobacteria bacterium]|nr:RDD family protein [Acidobacteriota bacterium]
MICYRCRHWNSEDDHRCAKCATRLNDRMVSTGLQYQGALALQPRMAQAAVAELEPESGQPAVAARTPKHLSSLQQSLFALRDATKVVSIDGNLDEPVSRRPARVRTQKPKRQISASYLPQQGVLEFVPMPMPEPRRLTTQVEARISCNHEVASLAHRMVAGLWDGGIVAVLISVFVGVVGYLCEGISGVMLEPAVLAVASIASVIIALTYEAAFLGLRGETPGMRMAGLTLVDFDGRPPRAEQLAKRFIGDVLSILPFGCGYFWALVDEESLSWRDHISETFVTLK